MQRKEYPKKRARHIFHIGPHKIAMAVVNRKIALVAARGCRSDVYGDRIGHLEAFVTGKLQPKAEVDIFHITEEVSIESSNRFNSINTINGSGRAGGKNFIRSAAATLITFYFSITPCQSADVVDVAVALKGLWGLG